MRIARSYLMSFWSLIVVVAPLLAVCGQVSAAQWRVVVPADEERSEIAIDMDSLSVSEGWVGAWSKTEHQRPELLVYDQSKTYRSSHSMVRYKCLARQRQTLDFYDYADPNLAGTVVTSRQLAEIHFGEPFVFDISNVKPGSPQEAVLMAVCEAAVDRGLLKETLPWERNTKLKTSFAIGKGSLAVAAFLLPATLLCFPLVYVVWRRISKRVIETKFVAVMAAASWLLSVVLWTAFAPQIANLIQVPNEGVLMFVIGLVAAVCVTMLTHVFGSTEGCGVMKAVAVLVACLMAAQGTMAAEMIVVTKEIDDDHVIIERQSGEQLFLEKWSMRFSPLSFEGKSFPADISPMWVTIYFDDKEPIKWSIEEIVAPPKPSGDKRAAMDGGVIESYIKGEFEGWDGETVFFLDNGQIWQQAAYSYHYHYAYRPKVLIVRSGALSKMIVEGVSESVTVQRIK